MEYNQQIAAKEIPLTFSLHPYAFTVWQEVEPMYRECDHLHIVALTSALGVGVRVMYLDRGEGATVLSHDFPEDKDPIIHLLYRPGHYDILYKA